MMHPGTRLLRTFGLWLVLGTMLAACAPATPSSGPAPATGQQPSAAQPAGAPARPSVNRPMVIALREEPPMLSIRLDRDGLDLPFTVTLAHKDQNEIPQPMLATKLPSQDDGSWTVNPDGTMRTVWTLKPDLKWSDGKPLTAGDFAFAHQVYVDREIPVTIRVPENLMSSVVARDDRTLEINWRETYIYANGLNGADLAPLPRHILQDVYTNDKSNFAKSTYFTSEEFVGTGPYRITRWDKGVAIFGQANPYFVMGKPKIEQIELRPVTDGNSIVAGFLAGSIDFSEYTAVTVEHAVTLRDRWAQDKAGRIYSETMFGSRYMEFQHRDVPNHQTAVKDVRVRRALAHAFDKEALADAMQLGFGPAADSGWPKHMAIYQKIDRVIAKYPFDVRRSEQLLNEAGWTKGQDGMFRDASGKTLDMEVWATADRAQEPQIVADYWKRAGINGSVFVIPRALTTDPEARVSFPAAATSAHGASNDSIAAVNVTKNQTPNAQNRWTGKNRGSYSNPELDRLYDLAMTTLDPVKREDHIVELERIYSTDVAQIMLYYVARPAASRASVNGVVSPGFSSYLWNMWEWTLES
jgi:peptide/nickel transport system substrate-binding protein